MGLRVIISRATKQLCPLYHSGSFFSRFVKLKYDLGNGIAVAKSNLTVALDTWYTVSVSRVEKNATLTVTGDTPVSIVSPGSAIALDVKSSFYLGGVPSLEAINPNAMDSMVQDFLGCIRQLRVTILCQKVT